MLLLLITLLFPVHSVTSICNGINSTVVIPVQNVRLANGGSMKGLSITAGTPSQILSCLPAAYFNDTWIYNSTATFCQNTTATNTACETLRGGLYDGAVSSTYSGPLSVIAAGGDASDVQRTLLPHVWDNTFATDELVIGGDALAKFPIGMPGFVLDSAYDTQCEIGLGRASVLLNMLYEAKRIASHSYSWWWGIDSATGTGSMDGQLVLGGFDEAKVQSQNYTAPLIPPSTNCVSGMLVTITDIFLTFPNGTVASIVRPSTISACLTPDFPLIVTLPWTPYFANFESTTQTSSTVRSLNSGIGFYGMLFPPNEVFEGDMTIELSDGLQFEFPNDLLVVPPAAVMSDGLVQTNDSVRELLINPTLEENEADTAILGRHFFQSAYLTVDYDANTFTVFQSNPTTDTNILALASNCDAVNPSKGSTSSPTGTGSNPTSKQTGKSHVQSANAQINNSSNSQSSVPVAVIAGAVVGSTLGVLGLAAIGLIICHQRRKRKSTGETYSSLKPTGHEFESSNAHEFGELDSSKPQSVLELRAEHDPYELCPISMPPQELPNTRWTHRSPTARSLVELG